MIEKFSVRKPFTVLVGVILIVVLGVVSFTQTSTDLLPSMNLPVAAIMTTYVGATPEQVEGEVTSHIETLMGTIGGIDSIISISAEHFSVVILTFIQSTNMDTASLEMRESLDMAQLPEGAGKPLVLKLNPEMMPVMVASLYMDGIDQTELSELAENELIPLIEGVAGVASVMPMGLIRNQLHVIISEDKIEEINQEIQTAVEAMIAEAMKEAMAEAAAAAEQAIAEQVAAYSEERIAELMSGGMSLSDANARLQAELPEVTSQISSAVMSEIMAEMSAAAESEGFGQTAEFGIPSEMLNIDTISGMLQAQNFSMPAGVMTESEAEYMVRVGDKFTEISEIADMLIFDPSAMGLDMEPIRLSDVADVFATDNSDTQYTHINGSPTVMLMIQKQTNFATSDLTQDIRARMDSMEKDYPGLGFAFLMDQGEYIGVIIGSVLNNLVYGGLLAVLILLLFLWDIRPTLIVAVSIPVSLMLAFTAMYFTGVSLNIISMSGLALAVGMLVDNSIVVIENIYRIRSKGDSAARAAVIGAKQVAGAIGASTLTTISVFFPIVFTQGLTRELFTDLALTIAYSLLASLLIALTVVPAASSALFKNVAPHESKRFNRIRDLYAKVLRPSLRVKWLVVIVAVGLFAVTLWVAYSRGTELFPAMESPQISVTAELSEDTTFDQAVETADFLYERIASVPDVETVGVTLGGGGIMGLMGGGGGGGLLGGGGTSISIYILLSEERTVTNDEVVKMIRERTVEADCELTIMGGDADMMSMMAGDPISVRIQGRELDAIRDTAIEVAEIVKGVPGAINVTNMDDRGAPELRIRVDKDAAMSKGLTVAQVFMAVNQTLTEPERTVSTQLGGRNYELVISDGRWESQTRSGLEDMEIANTSGELVKLADIAEIYDDTGFTTIMRRDRNRFLTITGEIEDGYNVGLVNDEIAKRLDDYTPALGCSVHIGGEAEAISDAFGQLYLMLALALVFIYLIMVAQFQSLLSPFIIMFTIPLAFTGGFLALIIAGMPLSVVSVVGFVLLTGVVVNNGIVFVDRINQQRREGMNKKDAIVEAGRIRLRPIVMTALTTIMAMSVMALGTGEGTEMVQPMAVVTIGGLIYATFMTMFVIPALYDILHRNKAMKVPDIEDL